MTAQDRPRDGSEDDRCGYANANSDENHVAPLIKAGAIARPMARRFNADEKRYDPSGDKADDRDDREQRAVHAPILGSKSAQMTRRVKADGTGRSRS